MILKSFIPLAIFISLSSCNGKPDLGKLVPVYIKQFEKRCLGCDPLQGLGEIELRKYGCDVIPYLDTLYDSAKGFGVKNNIAHAVRNAGRCECKGRSILLKAMKEEDNFISIENSIFYAQQNCPDVLKILATQLNSSSVLQKVAAIYGLQELDRRAVPILLSAWRFPDTSIDKYNWYRQTKGDPLKIESDPLYWKKYRELSAKEVKDTLEVLHRKNRESWLHGLASVAIDTLSGASFQGDTAKIKEWIHRNQGK